MTNLRRLHLFSLAVLLAGAVVARGGEEKKSELEAERARAAAARIAAMETARKAFVKLVFTPKWEEECALESSVSGQDYARRAFWQGYPSGVVDRMSSLMELHRNRRSQTSAGLVVGKGLIILADDGTGYEWRLIDKIEAVDASGKRWEVERHKLLTDASAIVFKSKGDGPEGVPFKDGFKLGLNARLYGATLRADYQRPDQWCVLSGGACAPWDSRPVSADRLRFVSGGSLGGGEYAAGTLLMNREGVPVGVNVGGVTLRNGNRVAWSVKEMLSKGALDYSRVHEAERAAREQCLKLHYKIRFEFRVNKEAGGYGGWAGRYGGAGAGSRDAETYGLSVGGGRLFVPHMLKVAMLRKVEKVSVKIGEDWKKARFLAAFKNYNGMLVELPGVKLNEPSGLYQTRGVQMTRPFVFCTVRELLGETNAFAKAVRYRAKSRGYKDRIRPEVSGVPSGSVLFDMDGKLAGICVTERRDLSLQDLGRDSDYYMGSMKDLLPFSRLKENFTKPEKFAHPTWKPMSKQESKRLVWLGVEFDPITKELAKTLKVKKPTRGGAIGYMVSSVYDNSPAKKMGIKPQDILLRLEIKGMGDPVHLVAGRGGSSGFGGRYGRMRGGMRTWRPRINTITVILTTAGPGYEAEIVYYSNAEKKVKKASWKLAYGPLDFNSADKYKDEKLGLSIKPVTYEVRRALAMKPDAPGVIISKVEQGSAAQLARLGPYMVITHIESEPVKDVEGFKKKIAKLREAKKEKAKLQVSIMGKSRFADLKLED